MVGKRFFILLVIALFAVAGCGDSETATEGDGDSHVGDGDGEPDPDGDGEPDPDGDGEPDPDGDGEPDPDGDTEPDPDPDGDTEPDPDGDTEPDPDPAECQPDFGEADACGGDPVGSWSFDDVCTDYDLEEGLGAICTGVVVSEFTTTSSGTLVVTSDNFARDVGITVYGELSVPVQCGLTQGCPGIEDALEGLLSGVTAECVDDGTPGPTGNCDCVVDGTIEQQTAGSYTAEDGVIDVDNDNTDYHYCVDEDTNSLSLRAIVDDGMPSFTELYLAD